MPPGLYQFPVAGSGAARPPRGAEERRDRRGDRHLLLVGVRRAAAAGPHGLLFQERQDLEAPAGQLLDPDRRLAIDVGRRIRPPVAAARQELVGVVVVLKSHAQLLQVVVAVGPPGRLPGRLDGRQQQGHQDPDNGDHHQQLDQGEPRPAALRHDKHLYDKKRLPAPSPRVGRLGGGRACRLEYHKDRDKARVVYETACGRSTLVRPLAVGGLRPGVRRGGRRLAVGAAPQPGAAVRRGRRDGLWPTWRFWMAQGRWSLANGNVDRHIALQVTCDIAALALLLYFSDLPHNPFLFYFVLPMIIAGMYLRRPRPYIFGGVVTLLVGLCMYLQHRLVLPRFPLYLAGEPSPAARRHVFVDLVRRLCQHAVDHAVFRRVDPGLRGPRPRADPAEGENGRHRPAGGRHRAPDRQSAGRRAELPAADRPARAGRPAADRIREDDGGGPGADREDDQAGAGLRPAARHRAAGHVRQRGRRGDAAAARAPPRRRHHDRHRAGRRAAGKRRLPIRCRKSCSTCA